MSGTLGALSGLRVLELSGPAGQPCGRLFGDLGADVILVEPSSGTSSRYYEPFVSQSQDPERSIYFLHFNTNKRSICIDIETKSGRETLLSILQTVDIVIESFDPGYLDSINLGFEEMKKVNPEIILASLSPFGQSGPYKEFIGTDITLTALSGLVLGEGSLEGPPINMPRYQGYQMAALHAAFGILIALRQRNSTDEAQKIDVSRFEVLANFYLNFVRYSSQQVNTKRRGSEGGNGPTQYYQTKDGWVQLALTTERQWIEFAKWTGDEQLNDPKYRILQVRDADGLMIVEKAKQFISTFSTKDFLDQGEKRKVTVSPAHSPSDFDKHPHTRVNEYFTKVIHPVVGEYQAPGAPATYSETPWKISSPAPLLGQHSQEILDEIKSFKTNKITKTNKQESQKFPLHGIRILAFERVWAAPFGTRYLADFGAEVIKVESTQFSDGRVFDKSINPSAWLNTNSTYGEINRNKKSITLDLHTEEGQSIFKDLVKISDVVVENNAPGAMEKFNLSYNDLKKIKKDIIMVSCPGFGSQGPMSKYVAVGQSITAFTGLGYLWAHENAGWSSRGKNAYPDFITASNLPLSVLAALYHRDKTGIGQHIEIAQFKSAANTIGIATLENQLSDKGAAAWGNSNPNAIPQGIYPCKGEDRWVAISCPNDKSWASLVSLINMEIWLDDAAFASKHTREAQKALIDEKISAWTIEFTPDEIMHKCQLSGVPAGVVSNGEDLYSNPQLRARDYVVEIDHPMPGLIEHPGLTIKISGLGKGTFNPAPTPGQHTEEILRSTLNLNDEDIQRLRETGALS